MIGTHTLSALVAPLAGELQGNDLEFSLLTTDTRTLTAGSVYLALQGERFDGNDFVFQAQERGAGGAIVSRLARSTLPQLKVADTHKALGQIAAINRSRSEAYVVALTGSQGKTTVKELAGAILKEAAPTLVTAANLNNTIGVPLTLLQLEHQHRFAVIEMGANGHGEIAFSVAAAKPDLVLITNASAAHIEGFGSLAGIVKAKGEIIDGVKQGGTVLLNADDPNCAAWQQRAQGRRTVLFSRENAASGAQYYARDISLAANAQSQFVLVSPVGEMAIVMQLLGKHNVMNAVAAAAAAMEAGASLEHVAAGLAKVAPVPGRLSPQAGINGSWLIDDSYNASPGSFCAAIDVLMCHNGPKYLVAGDMRELGQESEEAHRLVGEYAARAGVDQILAVGESSRTTAAAAGKQARHFDNKEDLIQACRKLAVSGATFLIKGSRGARMDTVVTAMTLSEEM